MSDACCGHEEPVAGHAPEPERLWQVTELRAAAIAGVLLAGAFVSGWADAPSSGVLALEGSALVIGASTFVPSTLQRLVKGRIDDKVFAGSINGTGALEVEVTTTAEDNSLVRIVEAEQSRKGASQRLADRIAKPLVPGIMIASTAIATAGSVFGRHGNGCRDRDGGRGAYG